MDDVNDPADSDADLGGDATEEPQRREPVDLGTIVAHEVAAEASAPPPGDADAPPGSAGWERTTTFAAYAQQQGLQFNLYVRGSTTLSGPLQAAVDNGTINLIRSLPG